MQKLVEWMNVTPWSIALRESFFVWPILEATHVLTIMLFVGTIIVVDLRLLGVAFQQVPVPDMTERILPLTVIGFVVMLVTGLALFYAKPLLYYHNVFFRIKVILLLIAMANIVYFHKRIQSNLQAWSPNAGIPRAASISAGVSLSTWLLVIIVGRLIAYDWYNCEKLSEGSFLHGFSSCAALESTMAGWE